MVVHDDTQVLATAEGELTVQWGWNRWVVASLRDRTAVRAQVNGRRALARLFVAAGLPEEQAASAARESWPARPRSAAHGEAEAWGSPWSGLRYGTLVVVLAGLVAMVLCAFWLKLSWVAV